jgi:hypothetical protein
MVEREWDRYGMGFERGMVHGRQLLKGVIVRRLRKRLVTAAWLADEGPGMYSPYWEARADLLELLIREVEEL